MDNNSKFLTLVDVLTTINQDTSLLGSVFGYKPNSPLAKVFAYGFVDKYKWKLPEGEPPFKKSVYAAGTAPCDLLAEIRKGYFKYFVDENIASVRRETLFIRMLEQLDVSEANVVIAIKDQKLTEMFPNITYDVLLKYNYVPPRPEGSEVKAGKSKSKSTTTRKPRTTRARSKTNTAAATEPTEESKSGGTEE